MLNLGSMQTSTLSEHPIGIFDSGMGGLTVAKSITDLLPNENIVYFGDTAHTPWGDKSLETVQKYTLQICDILLAHRCKYIIIACHTASAIASNVVQHYVGSKAFVLNVIDPVIHHIQHHHANKKIGLIGTKQTIRSNTYKHRLEALNLNIQLASLATPLLVPLIEEGFKDKSVSEMVVSDYLSHPNLGEIEALILGCTHYPLLKSYIQKFYQDRISLIDASEMTAQALKIELTQRNLLNAQTTPNRIFYASDDNEFFRQTTQLFFQSKIDLKAYPL